MTVKARIAMTCALAAAVLILWSAGRATAKGEAEPGRSLTETCLGCHGSENYHNAYPNYKVPRLGGQNAEYIVVALQGYRDGQRKHDTMHSQAATLTDEQMRQIGDWFAVRGGEPAEPGNVPTQAESCAACHGRNGVSTVPAYPNLGGQHADYLSHTLQGYKSGERQSPIMAGLAAPLSDQDIELLARYFASLSGLETPER